MKKIACLIPSYNEDKKFLKDCIQSAIDIDYENKDILILDDGSDNLNNYNDYLGHENVYLFTQPNKKLPQTLNNLFYLSQNYDYITWGSSDNIWGKKFIKEHLNEFEKHDIDITYSNYCLIDNSGNFMQQSEYRLYSGEQRIINGNIEIHPINLMDNLFKILLEGENYIGCSFLIKSKIFINYFNLDGIEDYIFWLSHIFSKSKFHFFKTKEIIYKYRIHHSSATMQMMNHDVIDKKQILLKKHLLRLYLLQKLDWDWRKYENITLSDFFNDFVNYLYKFGPKIENYDSCLKYLITIFDGLSSPVSDI